MKKLINILFTLLLAVVATSCLENGLEELDTYTDCDITSGEIYWRYYGTDVIPGSGETQVKQVRLARAVEQDADNNTFYIRYVTGNLPADQVSAFTTSKVVIAVTISTAAVIKPIDGSPTLGVPGDWSKPNKYEVMAANGDKKVWTIVVEPYQN
ncbi:MAG: hypothetical protein MR387_00320 [Phocaeicola plebeius]|nr:hypothetical protein [Phocaeicola plebeius]